MIPTSTTSPDRNGYNFHYFFKVKENLFNAPNGEKKHKKKTQEKSIKLFSSCLKFAIKSTLRLFSSSRTENVLCSN